MDFILHCNAVYCKWQVFIFFVLKHLFKNDFKCTQMKCDLEVVMNYLPWLLLLSAVTLMIKVAPKQALSATTEVRVLIWKCSVSKQILGINVCTIYLFHDYFLFAALFHCLPIFVVTNINIRNKTTKLFKINCVFLSFNKTDTIQMRNIVHVGRIVCPFCYFHILWTYRNAYYYLYIKMIFYLGFYWFILLRYM